jgi:hypothetical protein
MIPVDDWIWGSCFLHSRLCICAFRLYPMSCSMFYDMNKILVKTLLFISCHIRNLHDVCIDRIICIGFVKIFSIYLLSLKNLRSIACSATLIFQSWLRPW